MAYQFITQYDSPNFTPFQIVTHDNSWIAVDKEDAQHLERKWSFSEGYAKRYYEKKIDGKRVRWVEYLHRVIAGAKNGEIVDHINGDTTDNRRSNLRVTNKTVNGLNTKKNKGVYFSTKNNRWYARITVEGKTRSLGGYSTEQAAKGKYQATKKEVLCTLS